MPSLYVIIIVFAILGRSFWLLVFLTVLFGWPALVGRGAGRVPAGAQLRICPRGPGAGRVEPRRSCSATCCPTRWWPRVTMLPFIITGTIGTLAIARLPGLRSAVLGAVAGRTDLAGQAEPAGALAGLHRLLHLRDHAVASGVHLRGRARRLRPAKDLLHEPPVAAMSATLTCRASGRMAARSMRCAACPSSVDKGETVALVGESGSGKSVTALSTVQLAGRQRRWSPGRSPTRARRWSARDEAELRRVRGNDISFIFQEPMTSLNPLHTHREAAGRKHRAASGPARRRGARADHRTAASRSASAMPKRALGPIRTSCRAGSASG